MERYKCSIGLILMFVEVRQKKIISGGIEMIKAVLDKMEYEDTCRTDYRTMLYAENTKVLETALEMYERSFSYRAD